MQSLYKTVPILILPEVAILPLRILSARKNRRFNEQKDCRRYFFLTCGKANNAAHPTESVMMFIAVVRIRNFFGLAKFRIA